MVDADDDDDDGAQVVGRKDQETDQTNLLDRTSSQDGGTTIQDTKGKSLHGSSIVANMHAHQTGFDGRSSSRQASRRRLRRSASDTASASEVSDFSSDISSCTDSPALKQRSSRASLSSNRRDRRKLH